MERRDICIETVKQTKRRETSKARHSQPKRLHVKLPDRPRERLPPEQQALAWQQPQKLATFTSCPPPAPTPIRNAFETLEVEEMEAFQPAKRLEDAPKLSTNQPKKRKWRKKKPPAKSDQEVESTPQKEDPPACAGQHLTRPHKSSYFLPGKAASLIMLYLVDTGCNTKLTSKRIFNRIPQHIQDQLTSCDTHGQMADGTKLPFYGVVQVPIKVRDVKLEEIFVVSQIRNAFPGQS